MFSSRPPMPKVGYLLSQSGRHTPVKIFNGTKWHVAIWVNVNGFHEGEGVGGWPNLIKCGKYFRVSQPLKKRFPIWRWLLSYNTLLMCSLRPRREGA